MSEKRIYVNNDVGIYVYSVAVQEIVKKFFDEDGNYTPHFGRINSVGVFFSYFVDNISLTNYFSEVEDNDINLDLFLNDEYCMELYNDALYDDVHYGLNFANAYIDALDIVKSKNSTLGGAIEQFKDSIIKIMDKIAPVFTEDTIDKLSKLSEEVANGNLSAESIVEAYANSPKLKAIE